ncbi:Uu.00g096310.m01.CDS01 [Anthostomella pinea]|uniref:Uu.00g096310.m01.CDS01 n=1 Tax=Anthostomella pinea TaxID=933095 RepID=A0AAI8VCR2_9PEZI|nr:Uu.00g096310.m01.CDS01 [Anthostomella pinea]
MENYSSESKDRLLEQADGYSDSHFDGSTERHNSRLAGSWIRTNALSLAILALLLYIAVLQTVDIASKRAEPKESINDDVHDAHSTLADPFLEYEDRQEWYAYEHPWKQEPSEELDAVWDNFLYARNVRVTADEMDLAHENKTERLRISGGDYAGVLGVFHHMHCLNNLRRALHWGYYGPHLAETKHPDAFSTEHSGNQPTIYSSKFCPKERTIASTRSARRSCAIANTAVYTALWHDDAKTPLSKDLTSNHEAKCVKWDSLDSWARERALVPGQYNYLPGPYESNKVDRIGGR